MAREIFATPITPAAILKLEVARFAAVNKLNQGEEAHQLALLDGLCQAFRSKLIALSRRSNSGRTSDSARRNQSDVP